MSGEHREGGVNGAAGGKAKNVLPNGWAWARLEDLASSEPRAITDGPFGSNLKSSHYVESGPRVIRLQNIGDGVFRDEYAHISESHFESLERHSVRESDLVVASLGENLPRACIIPRSVGPAIVKADCIRVRMHDEISPAYVNFALQRPEIRDETATKIKGVGRPRLGMAGIKDLRIPLAPLAEQERVVAAIEEHLSRLCAAEAAVAGCLRKLDHLLRSMLEASCIGVWPTRPLREVTQSLRNGVFVSRPGVSPPGDPIFRISAVRPLNLRTGDVRYADPPPEKAERYRVAAGDLLFTRYSGNPDYVGAAAVVPDAGAGILHPDKLIRVVADSETALPDWIAAYVAVGVGRRHIEGRLNTTAGQVGISGSQLGSVPIAVPPLDQQREMVDQIAAVRAQHRRTAHELSQAEGRGRVLRRSVLAAAFSGQLVSQDPNDEPAGALLDRIAAERAAKPTTKTRRKKQESSR